MYAGGWAESHMVNVFFVLIAPRITIVKRVAFVQRIMGKGVGVIGLRMVEVIFSGVIVRIDLRLHMSFIKDLWETRTDDFNYVAMAIRTLKSMLVLPPLILTSMAENLLSAL